MRAELKKSVNTFAATIVAVLGLCLAAAALIFGLIGEGTASLVPGVLAIMLGVLSYAIGTRRLGIVTIVLGLLTMFFGVAASQGVIPGLSQTDHEYPQDIPRTQSGEDVNEQ